MAKRGAGNQLTHENWDEEEESEEAGTFKAADEDVLKTRVIKKAKRKSVTSDSSGTGGAFKGFAGFTSFKPSSTEGTSSLSTSPAKPLFGSLFNGSPATTNSTSTSSMSESSSVTSASTITATKTLSNGQSKSSSRSKYVRQLKALNESVTQWIREHVEKNPYCILSPIFADYNKYLEEINSKFPEEMKEMTEDEAPEMDTKTESSSSSKNTAAGPVSTPASTCSAKSDIAASPLPKFTFGSKDATVGLGSGTTTSTTSAAAQTTGGFSFKSLGSSGTTGASGGMGGFSFAVGKPQETAPNTQTSGNDEDETYEPPKPEVNEVKEEDAFFTQKCKMFFKKDGGWQEKGVGHLHLKPCGDQTQLLVRADTSLGNILLNIKLTSSLPANRQGKNNVVIVCIPNPPMDEKNPATPATLLLRLRTGEDADKLLEEINKHK